MRAWMKSRVDADAVSEGRLHRWALWAGVTEARRSSGVEGWDELEEAAARNGLQGEGSEDFWRGYGLGLLLRQEGQEEIDFHIAGAPGLVVERLAEGAGLGTAYASCNGLLRQKLVEQLPSSQHVALWYGFGRADLYCRAGDALHRPAEMDTAYMEGFRDAWFLDYGTRPDREVDPDWLERLKIY